MTNLKLQKRLAASILGVGKRRVWLDPNDMAQLATANSRQSVKKLITQGFIRKAPMVRGGRATREGLGLPNASCPHPWCGCSPIVH